MFTHKLLLFSETANTMISYVNRFAEVSDMATARMEKLSGWVIKNVEIFKAGTYSGQPYTEDDLDQMVTNFEALRSGGQFEPVFKKDHSESVENQIGWIVGVRREGSVLLGDLHVTEWSAYDKIESGTWKYLSSEIYPPVLASEEFGIDGYVLRGVAIVSVPKVKGLKGLILNSEIVEDDQGGENVDKAKLIAMLAKLGINFSEEEAAVLTIEDLESKLTAKFSELKGGDEPDNTPGGQPAAGGVQSFGEGQFVVMTPEHITALAQQMASGQKKEIDLFAEINTLKSESKKQKIERQIEGLVKAGKVTPAERSAIELFAEKLEGDTLKEYMDTFEKRVPVVEFSEKGSHTEVDDEDKETEEALKMFGETFSQKTYE